MKASGIVAVVPMKPLRSAKTRLASELSASQREALSINMLRRVVTASLDAPVSRVWVVGGDATVARTVALLGAECLDDDGVGLNDALRAAFQKASAANLASLYLPADLPFVTVSDVTGVVDASDGGRALTLAPARRDGGTNAILSPLGSPFRICLGADSFRRHSEQAAALGVPVAIFECPGIGYDLDTLADLRAYEQMEPGLLERLMTSAQVGTG